LKNDLSIRPIYYQLETRIEAHIFIAFLAYCLLVTRKQRLKTLAPGLTARVVLEKLDAMQMIDVELPTLGWSSCPGIRSQRRISCSCFGSLSSNFPLSRRRTSLPGTVEKSR
jgi:hypothetical protein